MGDDRADRYSLRGDGGKSMTLSDLLRANKPHAGMRFRRASLPIRVFSFDDGKRNPFLACSQNGDAAPFFNDDLAADDWEIAPLEPC